MKKKLIITAFVTLLTISLFTSIPIISSENDKTIRVGVIAASTAELETTELLFKKIIQKDINKYSKLKFEFLIEDAEGQADIHQEKVEQFRAMGVDLIIGGLWSSQAAASREYVTENDMLLISSSSTDPQLAIEDDNLFRLCPDDTIQGRILARMISTHESGIEKVIIIQRDDTWGHGLYERFEAEYTGSILQRYVYPTETDDFHSYLANANAVAEGQGQVAVLLISFPESVDIITQASETQNGALLYPNIYGEGPDPRETPWFGTESTGRYQSILDEAPEQGYHLKLHSALSTPADSPEFYDLNERYLHRTGLEAGYYTTTLADVAWIIAHSVLESGSSSATDVIAVLPGVASDYYGYSGQCTLNAAGDRHSGNYDIWGFYRQSDGTVYFKKYGDYDGGTDVLTWY